jgi:hypothetical protein
LISGPSKLVSKKGGTAKNVKEVEMVRPASTLWSGRESIVCLTQHSFKREGGPMKVKKVEVVKPTGWGANT